VTFENGITSTGADNMIFTNCAKISSITFGDSITYIGKSLFLGASSLTSVTLPDSLTGIGYAAFAKSGLTSITIPASVTDFGNSEGGAFWSCANLTSAYFMGAKPTFWGRSSFWNCSSSFTLYYHVSQAASWSEYNEYPSASFCTLTLDTQNGNAQTSSFVTVTGGHIAAPSDPVRSGYIFGGWYKEPTCINAFDFGSQTVTNDVKLYAKWNTPDLNGDHVIDVSDLVSIGLHWGQTGTAGWLKEDLNRDGMVDVCDLVQIGLYWGRSY
jgi:uncharacterized repeat protein (TIGR02543 family)